MRYWNSTSRIQNDVEIPGMYTLAFVHNGSYFVSEVRVYQDGMIHCWELVDFEGFKQKIAEGWVVTTLPNNAFVSVSRVASFTATAIKSSLKEKEFIKEVADVIEELNGRPTSMDKCRDAFQRFQNEQSEDAVQSLEEAYEAVPEHMRWFVLDALDMSMDDINAAFKRFQNKGP